jgi:hypothetical protein
VVQHVPLGAQYASAAEEPPNLFGMEPLGLHRFM